MVKHAQWHPFLRLSQLYLCFKPCLSNIGASVSVFIRVQTSNPICFAANLFCMTYICIDIDIMYIQFKIVT